MSDKQKYRLKQLRLERELVHAASKLAIVIGGVLLLVIAAWKLL